MIQSKEELKEYIEYESHGFSNKFPDSIIGEVIKKNGILSQLQKGYIWKNCLFEL